MVQVRLFRQPREDLPGHPEEELVARPPDQVSAAVHPKPALRAQPRRPTQQRGSQRVEEQQEAGREKGPGVDCQICQRVILLMFL